MFEGVVSGCQGLTGIFNVKPGLEATSTLLALRKDGQRLGFDNLVERWVGHDDVEGIRNLRQERIDPHCDTLSDSHHLTTRRR